MITSSSPTFSSSTSASGSTSSLSTAVPDVAFCSTCASFTVRLLLRCFLSPCNRSTATGLGSRSLVFCLDEFGGGGSRSFAAWEGGAGAGAGTGPPRLPRTTYGSNARRSFFLEDPLDVSPSPSFSFISLSSDLTSSSSLLLPSCTAPSLGSVPLTSPPLSSFDLPPPPDSSSSFLAATLDFPLPSLRLPLSTTSFCMDSFSLPFLASPDSTELMYSAPLSSGMGNVFTPSSNDTSSAFSFRTIMTSFLM
mmetsp:Transcript_8390/g.13666  ORF Transcript_8390/g.13666 Transcript_8390/m.13666 type:complete len:250 (-) Transcript_8390:218-967(-)